MTGIRRAPVAHHESAARDSELHGPVDSQTGRAGLPYTDLDANAAESRERQVTNLSPQIDEKIPRWDVALEALMREEHQHLGRPIGLGDVQRLARQYAIRFDDMMTTLFELMIHRKWEYRDEHGTPVPVTREQFERLAGNGRIEIGDVSDYTGGWRPVL